MRKLVLAAILLCALSANAERRVIEPQIFGPSHRGASDAKIAYAGGRFLTVWHGDVAGLSAVLHDSNGRQLTPIPINLGLQGNSTDIDLYPDGEGFVLTWNSHTIGTYVTHIDRDGKVTSNSLIESASDSAKVAFNGTSFLVWTGGREAGYKILDRNLSVAKVGSVAFPVDVFGHPPSFFPRKDGFLVYANSSLIQFASDGTVISQTLLTCRPCTLLHAAQTDGGRTLLILRKGEANVTSALLDRDGAISAPTQMPPMIFGAILAGALVRQGHDFQLFIRGKVTLGGPDDRFDLVAFTLDPAGAPKSTPQLIETGVGSSRQYKAAFNDRVTVLVRASSNNDLDIHTLVLSDLRPTEAVNILVAPKPLRGPFLASAGETFLAAWIVESRTGYVVQPAVHYAAVDANGIRTSPVRIEEGWLLGDGIVSNGNEFLLLRYHEQRIIATRVDRNGVKLSDVELENHATSPVADPLPIVFDASVAWTGNGYLAIWSEKRQLRSAYIRADGTATPTRFLPIPYLPTEPGWAGLDLTQLRRERSSLASAWNGSVVLLAFSEIHVLPSAVPGGERYSFSTAAVRLTATGDSIGGDVPVELGVRTQFAAGVWDIATDGTDFMVSWKDELLTIQADPSRFLLGRRQFGGSWAITWAGSHYVASTKFGRYLTIRRLASAGTELQSPLVIDAPGIVEANRSGRIVILALEQEVVTYSQEDLAPVPAPPDAPHSVALTQRGTAAVEIRWSPPARLDNVDGYVVMTYWRGRLLTYRVVDKATQSLLETSVTDGARVYAFNAGGQSSTAFGGAPTKRRAAGR